MLKKADIILAVCLIVVGIGMTWFFSTMEKGGQSICITVDGQQYGVYSLQEDRTIDVKQGKNMNQITIRDGAAAMTDSNCRGQDCIHQGRIQTTAQTIVCLPHKIVVTVIGPDQEYDAVVQ